MANCFWVPGPARWETIRANAKQADIGTRVDWALDAIEADNPRLKGIVDKRSGRAQLEPERLGELVDPVSTIGSPRPTATLSRTCLARCTNACSASSPAPRARCAASSPRRPAW
jgi:hypothetical protein